MSETIVKRKQAQGDWGFGLPIMEGTHMSHKRKIDCWERVTLHQLLWRRNSSDTHKRDVLGMVLVMLFILLNTYITVYYTYLYLYIYYILIYTYYIYGNIYYTVILLSVFLITYYFTNNKYILNCHKNTHNSGPTSDPFRIYTTKQFWFNINTLIVALKAFLSIREIRRNIAFFYGLTMSLSNVQSLISNTTTSTTI